MTYRDITQTSEYLIVIIIKMYEKIIAICCFMSENSIVVGISSLWPSMK